MRLIGPNSHAKTDRGRGRTWLVRCEQADFLLTLSSLLPPVVAHDDPGWHPLAFSISALQIETVCWREPWPAARVMVHQFLMGL